MASRAVKTPREERQTRRGRVEERERTILKAARAEFVAKGFDGATMGAIARRAKIAHGTLYLYYEDKVELMRAVLNEFWDDLTTEAAKVVAEVESADFYDNLHALATYHIDAIITHADFLNLTYAFRRKNNVVGMSHDHLRRYVTVFDAIYRRGQDRGELREDAELWSARDVFYGGLEYSSRSILITHETGREKREPGPVVDNMIALFRTHYGAGEPAANGAVGSAAGGDAVAQKLDRVMAKLDRLEKKVGR